jgi:hypothetical protein
MIYGGVNRNDLLINLAHYLLSFVFNGHTSVTSGFGLIH